MPSKDKRFHRCSLGMVAEGFVGLPEVDVDPLGDLMLDFLIDRDKEEPFLDFKETLSIAKDSPFAKVAKDILAFSNYGCGFVLIGFREREEEEEDVEGEKRNFIPDGLPDAFHIDQADLQEKFNAYLKSPIQLPYCEFFRTFDGAQRKFAAIYVPPSTSVLRPVKSGVYRDGKGKEHKAFVVNSVLFRRGTQSVVASKEEVAWIEKRAERQGYRLSVLSGQPDVVHETVYSNLFEIVRIPDVIWTASFSQRSYEASGRKNVQDGGERSVYVEWSDRLVTFDDISKPESQLWNLVDPRSVRQEMVAAWVADPDKQRVLVWLLNKELRFLADRVGLLHEYRKQKFYFSCDGESRTETWASRFRASSTLTVAQRMWAQQLKRFIFWHLAVYANFAYLGSRLFLELSPTIQLSEDGRRAIFGEREGTVITRLTYNRYNSSYLNNILFWISRFAQGREGVGLAHGKVLVSAKPVESKLSVGILFDRPSAEPVQEVPEIEIMEGGVPRVSL